VKPVARFLAAGFTAWWAALIVLAHRASVAGGGTPARTLLAVALG